MANKQYDVIISGAGMVGATLACLLGKAGFQVAVLERAVLPPFVVGEGFSLRVSAISRRSQHVLQEAGAWQGVLSRRCQPYEAMTVWDATGDGEVQFDAADLGEPELGHIVENKVLQLALLDAMQALETIDFYCPAGLSDFQNTESGVDVCLDTGETLQGRVLVGADGSRSKVRELAGIGWQREDYGQKGLVCVVRTERPHQVTAWQRFMPGGPLAFLPLSDAHHSSIVWTLPADRADRLLQLDERAFAVELRMALDGRLGDVELVGGRGAFPLYGASAERYVVPGVALIGDAAHSIHPLAGQGVNLGIKDADELAGQLVSVSAEQAGRLSVLRRYERARRGDNVLTQKAMEGFRLLFGNTVTPLQWLRNSGLKRVDALPFVKQELARRAMGV